MTATTAGLVGYRFGWRWSSPQTAAMADGSCLMTMYGQEER
jgi:hypothetical protein